MTPFKKGLIIVTMVLMVIVFIRMIALLIPDRDYKYTVYAANKVYHCNEFVVTGRTIYFRDSRKKNVCINGEYTLIYETEDKK